MLVEVTFDLNIIEAMLMNFHFNGTGINIIRCKVTVSGGVTPSVLLLSLSIRFKAKSTEPNE